MTTARRKFSQEFRDFDDVKLQCGVSFEKLGLSARCTALGLLEISYLGNEDGVMDKHDKRGRRYSAEEKAAAVRMVGTLRAELGTNQGTVQRVATQLGYGPESVRAWVTQADIGEGKRESAQA